MTETTTAQRVPRSLLTFLRKGRGNDRASSGVRQSDCNKRFWNIKKLIALVMMLLVSTVGLFGATAANAKGEDGIMKFAFYNIASSTTAFFSTVQDPDSNIDGFSPSWLGVMGEPGSAGSMLGYADPAFSDVTGWLASSLSGSSDAIGYGTLQLKSESDTGGSMTSVGDTYRGMVDYAYFGASLKGMGLDGTSTGLSLGWMNALTGGIVMLLYLLSGAVDFLFTSAITVLDFLNPFKLFYVAISAISPDFAEGMVGGSAPGMGGLSTLASWIGGWYGALNSLSWTVMVPIFIATLLFSLVMFKKMDRGGALKKILIRITFIGLGVPLLGSMYTGMLSSMGDNATTGNAGSTRAVMSTYVDFESWATKSRLEIPDGAIIAWDQYAGQPTNEALANVRGTAMAINNQSMRLGLDPIISSGNADASWSQQVMQGRDAEDASPATAYAQTVDMLTRYMGNAQISAASFETAAKGSLTQSSYYQENSSDVQKWFSSLNNDSKGLNGLGIGENKDIEPALNPLIAVQPGTGLRAFDGAGGRQFTSETAGCYSWNAQEIVSYNDPAPRGCNLAPLAMYNYLNTDFGSQSMTMYSSQKAQSEATRSIHNSVNQVGTGTMSFLYWFNTVVLLGAFVMIGLGYGFAMIFSSIRRSFQIMTAVPFATLGAIAAIAKVIVYTVALILEVIVTIFVYNIVQEFLLTLPQIIEMPFASVLNNGSSGALAGFIAYLISGWAFTMIVTVFSIIGVLLFTVMALRVRKMLVKAVEEAVTKLVEKFMDTQASMPGGNFGQALAGGLASGAGSAATNRMMGAMKGNGAGNASKLVANPDAAGPAQIKTGGSTAPMPPGSSGKTPTSPALERGGQVTVKGGAAGNGDPGSPVVVPQQPDGDSPAEETSKGRDVEVNGLSKPDTGDMRTPQVEGDALSSASESLDKSAEGYKKADTKRLAAGADATKAVVHTGVAVGKGMAGDAAGAAESGGKAAEAGNKAVAAAKEAKQTEGAAGQSSVDKPAGEHEQAGGVASASSAAQSGMKVDRKSGEVAPKNGSKTAGPGQINNAARPAPKQTAGPNPGPKSLRQTSTPSPGSKSPKQTAAPKSGLTAAPKSGLSAPKKSSAPKQTSSPMAPKPTGAPKPVPKAPGQTLAPKQTAAPKPVPKAPGQTLAPKQTAAPKPAPQAPKQTAAPKPQPSVRASALKASPEVPAPRPNSNPNRPPAGRP